jgi:S1-C subfamily serine protease
VEGIDTQGNQAVPSVGSGFVVASGPTFGKTYVATAAHVLRGPGQFSDDFDSQEGWRRDPDDAPQRKVWLEFFDPTAGLQRYSQPAVVLYENPKNDVALLAIDGGRYPDLVLGDVAVDLPIGAKSTLIGYNKTQSKATYVEGLREQTEITRF